MNNLLYAVEMLADIIIEKEGAFGMTFGNMEFEARYKCDNTIAYCRNMKQFTTEEAVCALLAMREYFKESLGVEDEPAGICQ